jgi:hypothetical protein
VPGRTGGNRGAAGQHLGGGSIIFFRDNTLNYLY